MGKIVHMRDYEPRRRPLDDALVFKKAEVIILPVVRIERPAPPQRRRRGEKEA